MLPKLMESCDIMVEHQFGQHSQYFTVFLLESCDIMVEQVGSKERKAGGDSVGGMNTKVYSIFIKAFGRAFFSVSILLAAVAFGSIGYAILKYLFSYHISVYMR